MGSVGTCNGWLLLAMERTFDTKPSFYAHVCTLPRSVASSGKLCLQMVSSDTGSSPNNCQPTLVRRTDCPFFGTDRAYPATDLGETIEHVYGTCPGLDELLVSAAHSWTSAIQVGPHILVGHLGVVKVRNAYHRLGGRLSGPPSSW
jgi:hypothetical protein